MSKRDVLYRPVLTGCSDTDCIFRFNPVGTNGGCTCRKELLRTSEGRKAVITIEHLREQLGRKMEE